MSVSSNLTLKINYVLLVSRQGRLRLDKWFVNKSAKNKQQIIKEVTQMIMKRQSKMCNFLDYKDGKIIYKRYASLFFILSASEENELEMLQVLHRYVEVLDGYFGNVCELDIIFNFEKAVYVLDELLMNGEVLEPSKSSVQKAVSKQDELENIERNKVYF